MSEKINMLLFDFTKDNLEGHEEYKKNMTSGINFLSDIIQFENDEFLNSSFVQLVETNYDNDYGHIKDRKISNILGIDEVNLCFYQIYDYLCKKTVSMTREYLNTGQIREFKIIANKTMFKENSSIFEIRFKIEEDKWSSWQAIAGKFILTKDINMGAGGVAGLYSSITKKEIEVFMQSFQMRYSGRRIDELIQPNILCRIVDDPFNTNIRKIIDPTTFHILFDSQIIQETSSDKSYEIWKEFEKHYR